VNELFLPEIFMCSHIQKYGKTVPACLTKHHNMNTYFVLN